MKNFDESRFEYPIVFISVTEYSEILGLSEHILYHMIERRQMTYLKLKRSVRIPISLVNCSKVPPESLMKSKPQLRSHFRRILYDYDRWLTIEEVCNILDISKSNLKRILLRNELEHYVWHNTFLTYIDKDSLIEFIVKHCVSAKSNKHLMETPE